MFKQLKYVPHTRVLLVRFNNDTLYMYKGVPEKKWIDMQAAESMGKYFAKNIRNTIAYERIE